MKPTPPPRPITDTPRTKEEWKRLQRLPNGLYSPNVTAMFLAIGMNRFAEGLERSLKTERKLADDLASALSACRNTFGIPPLVSLDNWKELRKGQPTTCNWREDEDGLWHTACGAIHEFHSGTPEENKHRFCPYCGETIEPRPQDQ